MAIDLPVGYSLQQCVFSTTSPKGLAMVTFGSHGWTPTDPSAQAEFVAEEVWDHTGGFLDLMDAQNVLQQVRCYIGNGTPFPDYGEWNGSLAGAGSGVGVTPQVAVLVQKLTGQGGRPNRGRMYIPGLAVNSVNEDGIINTTPLANWQAAADDFLAQLATVDADMVILHDEGVGIPPTVVTSLSVQALVATQRRRIR